MIIIDDFALWLWSYACFGSGFLQRLRLDAADALNAFRGNMFVYIGESGEDSCTAEMSFFQSLSENWMLRAHRDTAHAPGCNDGIFFYERLDPLPLARA